MPRSSSHSRPRPALFWSLVAGVVAIDVITKTAAVEYLPGQRVPQNVFGEIVRLTLVYNPGAAFGLNLGPWSREIFLVLTVVALVILGRLYRGTRREDLLRVIALGLVCGGAVGNLIDRVRSPVGVVDFMDIGFRDWRWPTFNVADIAVSTGAFLLAWALWGEERRPEADLQHLGSESVADVIPEVMPEPKVSSGG
ncbi:MAG TPA: signal peptidase II [Gemmatimonadaceae bacterium]|nr:signal peptidase II [Gemmatimonadaceae bacterium]